MKFDDLFNDLGNIGLSQIIIVLMLSYCGLVGGINFLATVFITHQDTFRCRVDPFENVSLFPQLNETEILVLTTPRDNQSQKFNRCLRYGYNLKDCLNGSLICVNTSSTPIPCDQGFIFNQSLFTQTVITEFKLVCEKNYLQNLSTSLFYAGLMIGSIIFGNFADAFGRKMCCVITFIGVLGSMVGVSFSRSIFVYIGFRMATAIFLYGTYLGAFVYALEIVGRKWRATVGIGIQIFFAIGYMIFGGIAYLWRDWHHMMIAGTVVSIPFLIFAIILPESPRWLFAHNKNKKGIEVVKKLAHINGTEIQEESLNIQRDEAITGKKRYTSLDLFRTKQTRIISLKVMFNWFVNSLVYYGVSLNAGSLAGNLFVNNSINGVFEILSYIFCIFVMDRFGRKYLLSFLLLLAGVGLFVNVVINAYAAGNESLIVLGVVFAFIAKFGISGSFAVIYNLTSELYPTVIRTNGVGMGSFAARIGGIIAPYLIDLQQFASWLPNTIFGVTSVLTGLLSLTFPETTGNVMMETIEEAEIFYRNNIINDRVLDGNNKEFNNPAYEGDTKL